MLTVQAALGQHENLSQLVHRAAASNRCLQLILPLLPESMRDNVAAGAYEPQCWHLLVKSSAVMAKLKQMLPRLTAAVQQQGQAQLQIRLKRWQSEPAVL